MDNDKIVSVLNDLIEISRDGANGFRTCAADTHDVALKSYFENRAQSCAQAVNKLSTEVSGMAATPIPAER